MVCLDVPVFLGLCS